MVYFYPFDHILNMNICENKSGIATKAKLKELLIKHY